MGLGRLAVKAGKLPSRGESENSVLSGVGKVHKRGHGETGQSVRDLQTPSPIQNTDPERICSDSPKYCGPSKTHTTMKSSINSPGI